MAGLRKVEGVRGAAAAAPLALHEADLAPVQAFVVSALAMKLRGNPTNYTHIVAQLK